MSTVDPMAQAEETFEAAVQGKVSVEEARAAFIPIEAFRPKGMYDPEAEAAMDPAEKLYGDAVNCFKMALDALQSKQMELAGSYVRVAKLRLSQARGS